VNENLIGRCGLYCGFCEIYRAYKDSRELREELATKHNCSPEDVRCEGCQVIDLCGWSHETEWGKNCKFLRCLESKHLQFCYECSEYHRCTMFERFHEICSGLGIDLRQNLQMIQKGRIQEWLACQDKKWRCTECGNPVIVSYDVRNCHWCGKELRPGGEA